MKIRLIYPKFVKFLEDHPILKESLKEHVVGDYTMPPSLALPILAAITPPEIKVFLTDDNISQQIDYDEKVDLVAISCFTPQAQRAYEIADNYKKRKTPVVIGGIHPTFKPQEASEHVNSVCIGEGEALWHTILEDAEKHTLQPRYSAEKRYSLEHAPIPKRSIFKKDIYKWDAHHVITSRGCPVRCIGCPLPGLEGHSFRFRPIQNIIEDIKQMEYQEFYFIEDTLMLPGKKNQKYILNIMEHTRGLDVKIFLSSTMMMKHEYDFYTKLKQGGAASMYTVFGFDRVSKQLLSKECTRDEWQRGVDLVRMIEDNGIHFFASFGIGFDDQDRSIVDKILKFSDDAGIDLAEFYILTPFPGTPFGIQAEKEKRILHRNYSTWNHGNVVFKPLYWTEEELINDFYTLWKEFYKNKNPQQTTRTFNLCSSEELTKRKKLVSEGHKSFGSG